MARETDSGLSGLVMALVLGIFLAAGVIAWASSGTTNSTVNPAVTIAPSTPCSRLTDSFDALRDALQGYQGGTVSIESVKAATRDFTRVTSREMAAVPLNVRRSLGTVHVQLDKARDIMARPGATDREIADQTQRVVETASALPKICPH